MNTTDETQGGIDRRKFLISAGVGAVGLGAAAAGVSVPFDASATGASGDNFPVFGVSPASATRLRRFPDYKGAWVDLPERAFGGFDAALGYIAEGVQGMDPLAVLYANGPYSNSSGLFEQYSLQDPEAAGITRPIAADTGTPLNNVPSAVGGNEFPQRSVEFWYRNLLQFGLSNQAIADDTWGFINWARRMYGLDFDDPAADGIDVFGYAYQFPGSPDPDNEWSLLSPRYAVSFDQFDEEVVGFARMAPTYLAPDTGYTVIFRSGKRTPNMSGGQVINGTVANTTGSNDEEWPAKVRDGGIWGGVVQPMDVLRDIQAVARGERYFSTPDSPLPPLSGTTPPSPAKRGVWGGVTLAPNGEGPKWGQWWRRVAPIVGIDVDALDPYTEVRVDKVQDINTAANPGGDYRPAARPNWPIGWHARGTDFFWGNYDLLLGEDDTIPLHYQSEVPTSFRPSDGVPETFPCDLLPNPASAEIKARADMDCETGIGLFDSTGNTSGFPDRANPELDGQQTIGAPNFYGRVHGTSYGRTVRADGLTVYSFRNYLLWPPRLNTIELGDPSQPNFGNINWTIPDVGFNRNPANPTGLNPPPPGNAPFN